MVLEPMFILLLEIIRIPFKHFIVVDMPLKIAVPVGNIAYGFAWSYYFGYLNLILPGRYKKSKVSITQYVTMCI